MKKEKTSLLRNGAVQSLLASLLCILLGLLIGYIALLLINPSGAGEAILTIVKNFMTYSRATAQLKYLGNTLAKTAPLLMCSLSVLFAYKVGLFNIGAAGQYVVGAGASYAILVMMTASIVVGLVGGLSFQSSLTAMIQGGSKMFWMFFMFVLFEPFLNYVSASGAFDAVCQLMQPLIDVGGEVAFLMLSAAVGIFGISGTGVAQAQIIHELFLPMVQSLNIAMPIWGMVVLVGCQVTFFVTPTVDMVGQMGLARSKNIKAMLANGWVITVITFAYVLIRAILYTM